MRSSSRAAVAGVHAALLLLAGCGDPGARQPEAAPPTRDAGAAADCDEDAGACGPARITDPICTGSSLRVLRATGWPGGGLQLAVELRDASGAPLTTPAEASLELASDGVDLDARVEPSAERTGLTAIVVMPSDDAALHALRIAAASALALALPEQERIGVWLGAEGLPLVAELSERRAHVLARLQALAPQAASSAVEARTCAELEQRLARVGGPWGPLGRNLVIVGAAGACTDIAQAPAGHGTTAVTRLTLPETDTAGSGADAGDDSAEWDGQLDPEHAATALAERVATLRAATHLVASCGPFGADRHVALISGDTRCELTVPPPPSHLIDADCDPRAAARDEYPFPETIDLELTPEALELHDAYAADEREDDFPVRVVLGEGTAIEATAHFRGQTSLECERKNYSVNVKGPEPRRLMPGAASDEFYLISMCKERQYFRQVVASRIMSALGLFPLDQRYVRLRVAGREHGVYLLLEKPDETLLTDQIALAAVVRRRLDRDGKKPEAKYPDPDDAAEPAAAALASYGELAATIDATLPGQLYDALSATLDFDNYLRWMALNTYLQCGDYADETFFYASPELGTPGSGLYFRNHGWDADDLFATCHHRGEHAYADPHELVYCAEGHLDRALFVSDDVYARYVSSLERLMNDEFPPDAIAVILRDVRTQLFRMLRDDAVCAAMVELVATAPEAASCDRMRPLIRTAINAFDEQTRERAALLQSRIDAWRAAR
jgi:hypothetical protein